MMESDTSFRMNATCSLHRTHECRGGVMILFVVCCVYDLLCIIQYILCSRGYTGNTLGNHEYHLGIFIQF